MIPFGGRYTRSQWGRGIRLAIYPTGRALVLRLAVAALVLTGIGFIVASLLHGDVNASRLVRMAISLMVLGSWTALPYYRAWRAVTQPWRESPGSLGLKGTITEEGILSNASALGTVDRWDRFLGARVLEDLVVLVGMGGLAIILPREFFATEDHWQGFRQLVKFNVVAPK
jgi:hypothetical protein